MFNSLRGRLSEKRADSICIETGGVEWALSVPARAVDCFGSLGEEVRAFTWLHHYEDGMRLYGFPSQPERAVFLELLKVEGIGPKQALRVLSGIAPAEFEAALNKDDLAALQRVPGVGPKLAQKMLLALKGKLILTPEKDPRSADKAMGDWADIVRALTEMGFDRKQAERCVRDLAPSVPIGPERERELFRKALLELSAGI